MDPTTLLQSPLLIGRDQLLVLADDRLEKAAAGHGQVLLLAGEAGIGKTRLLHALLRKAGAAGFIISKGDLAPQDSLVPLASILDHARTMRQIPAFGTLGDDLLALRRDRGADSLASRRILVHDIAGRIVSAVDRPTLLAFEDLQWADELTLEVIGELARLAPERPLFLIGAYRPDELRADAMHREWRARLLSQRFGEEAVLAPLTYDETALATTLILGTGLPASRDVVSAIFERSDGVPLYIEELLAALRGATADGRAIRDAKVPTSIEDAIMARVGRLSADAQVVGRAAAVIGRCFVPSVLAGMLDRPVSDLDEPLDELTRNAFIFTYGEGILDFRHQLIRDALYRSVPSSELRRLHARAGEFGAQLEGASEIHASAHFERAGLRPQAYRAALAGADAASAVSSRHEAFELYARAVANIPDELSALDRAALYDAYCTSAFAVDDVEIGVTSAKEARRYYLEAGRPIEAAMALVSLAGMGRRDVWPHEERVRLLAEAEHDLEDLPESPERMALLSDIRLFQGIIELEFDRPRTRRGALRGSAPTLARGRRDGHDRLRVDRRPGRRAVGAHRCRARDDAAAGPGVPRRAAREQRRDRVPDRGRDRRAGHGVPSRGDRPARGTSLCRRDRAVLLPTRDGRDVGPRRVGVRPMGRGSPGG